MYVHVPTTNAKIRDFFEGPFECRFCGLEVPAIVYATGYGGATGHGQSSAEQATAVANENANLVASRTLQFVPCPKCGKRDPGGTGYRVQVLLGALFIGFVLYAFMQLWLTGQVSPFYRDRTPTYMSLVLGAIFFVPLYWFWGRPWRGIKKRVEIDMTRAVFHKRDDD